MKDGTQSEQGKETGTAYGAEPSNSSSFGRIQKHTEELIRSQIKVVIDPVLSYLPLTVSKEIRDWTAKVVLDTVLKDWRENGNLDPLTQQDVADLGSFVELSFYLATACDLQGSAVGQTDSATLKLGSSAFKPDSNQLRIEPTMVSTGPHRQVTEKTKGKEQSDECFMMTGESSAIYKTSLESLLYDWLQNWNADGNSGPPKGRD